MMSTEMAIAAATDSEIVMASMPLLLMLRDNANRAPKHQVCVTSLTTHHSSRTSDRKCCPIFGPFVKAQFNDTSEFCLVSYIFHWDFTPSSERRPS